MILLYGRTGSGKSTLAAELAKRTGLKHIEVDSFRAKGAGALAAQAMLIHAARDAEGPVIVECCSPTPKLAEMADLKVEVCVSDPELIWRLRRRGWNRAHIGRALKERYATRPDITVSCQSLTLMKQAVEEILTAEPVS